ncbi:MAG: hypothetical protein NVV82_11190 [Sporocytophaga sp.]|nr:hypothetical protein [Sporocytophaga sp.]
MKQLLFIISMLTFMACVDHKLETDNNLADTIYSDKESANKNTTIKAELAEYKILPIDESGSDSSLVLFINNLKNIVSNKDTSELFKILDTAIIVSHGGGINGIKEFSQNWDLDKPNESVLWPNLTQILNMGGTWEDDVEGRYFCIPYAQSNKAFSKYKYDFDWFFTAVCISPHATVYQEPKITSKELGTLSYDIVEMDPNFMHEDFTKINTINQNMEGYVKTSDLIYSAEQHLVIKKIDKNWKITAFAPFD